jgi:hypothetical protein
VVDGGQCKQCLAPPLNQVVAVLCALRPWAGTLAMLLKRESDVKDGDILTRIFLSYLAVTARVGSFAARSPGVLRSMLGWAKPVAAGVGLGELSSFMPRL